MSARASQITGVSIVRLTFCSSADKKRKNSTSLIFYEENPPVIKGPITRKMFPFDDFIMSAEKLRYNQNKTKRNNTTYSASIT